MNASSLLHLSTDQLQALANRPATASGGGRAAERDLALAVVLVAAAAGLVLALFGH